MPFSQGWHHTTVDDEDQVGWYTSLAILPGGAPAISYYDMTNGNLKYARQSLCVAHEH